MSLYGAARRPVWEELDDAEKEHIEELRAQPDECPGLQRQKQQKN
jgi:hypothetical protein